MLRRLAGVVIILFASATQSHGFEVQATIKKIDVDKRMMLVVANGQDRTISVSRDAKIQDASGQELSGGLAATELKEGARVVLNVEREGNSRTVISIRLSGKASAPTNRNSPAQPSVGRSSVGFKPLTEMTAQDRYKSEDGGLYGGGRNDLPPSLSAAAMKVTASIEPRDANGQPAPDGKVGLVSISMSNATQEFSRFKQLADSDSEKSPSVIVVDCAQGGQTMARWADPKAPCWTEADRRLQSAGLTPQQVQVAWVKLANAGPQGELHEHGRRLEQDTRTVMANLQNHFPNLKIAYLGSRIYGGYADGKLNPEPYAYEGAFVVRWLIQSQSESDADLNYDAKRGKVNSPLLLWGPYLWADGTTPRASNRLVWERSDFVGDGTHPSDSGRQKVAEQLLNFFKTDPHTQTWFVKR